MKAIVWTEYGSPDGLLLQEVEKPAPKDSEVRVKVHAATVTAGDLGVRSLDFPLWLRLPIRLYMGVLRPRNKILGQELAGEVEAVGKDVKLFRQGDQVYGTTGFRFGAYAEYTCLPEKSDDSVLAIKPSTMTYEEAAVVPTGGLEALYFLRKCNVQSGEKVLIVGAGGSIGTFAVQLAKYFGATVTGLDSTGKLDMLRSIGADHVIDYTQEDFTQNGETYDVIFDVIGKSVFSRSLRSLTPNGRYLLANPTLSQMLRGRLSSITGSRTVILGPASQTTEALDFLKGLIEAGVLKAVIDRRFPLEQTAAAHRYVETGQKKGHVVLTVLQEDKT